MRVLFSVCLLCISFAKGIASEPVTIGVSTSVRSDILHEKRQITIYTPPEYASTENAFPVIYLLDGDIHRFTGFVGVLESMSTETQDNQIVQAIVVAIPNTNRSRDLTPSHLPEWTFKGRTLETFEQTGKAGMFADFMRQELFPFVAKHYRTTERRILVGESFGGLFAADVLLRSPSTFTDYIIIDPTAVWDNNYLNRTYSELATTQKLDASVFFAFANNAHLGDIGVTNYEWGKAFASAIVAHSGANASQRYFKDETHGTVGLQGWYHGLKALMSSTQ